MFDAIYDVLHKEMHALADKLANGAQLSDADLNDIDTMAHALKCLATYEAMVDARDYPRERTRTRYRY